MTLREWAEAEELLYRIKNKFEGTESDDDVHKYVIPDLGTALSFAAIGFGMLFWAGLPWITLFVLVEKIAPRGELIARGSGFLLMLCGLLIGVFAPT